MADYGDRFYCRLFRGAKRGITEIGEFRKNLQFGFPLAIETYFAHVIPCRNTKKLQTDGICRLLQNDLKNELNAANRSINQDNEQEEYPVWVCWFTGIENSPEIVQACFSSVKRNLPENASVHLITLANYKEYVEIPDYCIEKFNNKNISAAAFSDILRACLLAQYGGLWLDATILVSKPVPRFFFRSGFYTLSRKDKMPAWQEPSEGRWCNFIWYSRPGNPLFVFLRDALLKYWKKYDKVIEYLLPDYIIRLTYNYLPEVKKTIDSCPSNIEDFWLCMNSMNKTFSGALWEQINNNSTFNKLTYKEPWNEQDEEGKMTLFGFVLNSYLK